ncbi:MAG: outer membrane beta-barrel protein [Bacteroidia bacterium]|nr:outer membrane beta-barrel protein [Bacteroidia bacterium]
MKKSTYITLFLITATYTALQAQTPYLNLYTGYAFGINKTSMLENYSESYNYDTEKGNGTSDFLSYSLGEGLNLGGALGYMVNENLGFEVGVNYTKSKSFEGSYKAEETSPDYDYNYLYEDKSYVQSTMTRITPAVIYQVNNNKASPYAKFGLAIGMGSITFTETESEEENDGTDNYKSSGSYVAKASGGISIGFNSTLGVALPVSKNISVFGEVSITNLSFAPNEREVTEAKWDGEDYLSDLSVNDKNTEYVDEYTTGTYNEDVPRTELKQPYAFSNAAVNIGVKFSLNK